jgi:hypothetical protein
VNLLLKMNSVTDLDHSFQPPIGTNGATTPSVPAQPSTIARTRRKITHVPLRHEADSVGGRNLLNIGLEKFYTPISNINRGVRAIVSNDHILKNEEGAGDEHRSIYNGNLPLMGYPTPGSSILVESDVSTCKRLISHAYPPPEIISLIEIVFKSEDEVKMIGDLRGDDAQTFIDVIHRVRLHPLRFRGTV